jgi:hypothetical protein
MHRLHLSLPAHAKLIYHEDAPQALTGFPDAMVRV